MLFSLKVKTQLYACFVIFPSLLNIFYWTFLGLIQLECSFIKLFHLRTYLIRLDYA